jgi:hypothetical protein
MKSSFCNLDLSGTARHELNQLKHTTDFTAYLTEYRRIIGKLRNEDAAQLYALELGLLNRLKDALLFSPRPHMMAECEKQLLASDNRIKARELDKKVTHHPMGQFETTAAAPFSFTPGGLTPMDLSATQSCNRDGLMNL